MKTFIVTVVTPAPDTFDEAVVLVMTPSGSVQQRRYSHEKWAQVPSSIAQVTALIVRMFPGKKNKVHGDMLDFETFMGNGSVLRVYRVDTDD
jgi:hypothetical protein